METDININNSKTPPDGQRKKSLKKLLFVYLVIFLGLLAVLVKVFFIQVVNVDKYKEMARKQHESRVKLRPERGNIYDRNGNLIVSSVKSISYAADPSILSDRSERELICMKLSKVSGIPKEKLLEKLNNTSGSFVWLARGLVSSDLSTIDSLNIKGFIKIEEPKRNFLFGSTGAQVTGCTDIDNKGITGIEMGWDSVLSGKPGYTIMLRDAQGRLRPAASAPPQPAENGKSIQLTIDMTLQRIVEYELKQGVEKSGAASGTVIAIEPSTGEILAMASYPFFNPNNLNESPSGSIRNRAITDVYEPGSTFKLITAASALEENMITPETMVDGGNGELQVMDVTIRDDHPVGRVTFTDALAKSSNIVFSNVANNIPANKFYKYIRDFGFGLSLGIDIPGEVPGKIKKASELDLISKRFTGFGYGLAVTPLQIVNAYAAVANNGVMMKPHVVSKIFNSEGETVYEAKPEKVRKVISEKTSKMLTNMLCSVVEHGTGTSAQISGIRVAGKTGTAQQLIDGSYKNKSYTASFVGFMPADNPKIAIMVVLDKPVGDYYGGTTAAPLFRNISQRWLLIRHEIMPKNINSVQFASDEKTVRVPDVTGLQAYDARQILRSYTLRCSNNADNNSVVVSQQPLAGSNTALGTSITINTNKNQSENLATIQNKKPIVTGMSLRRALNILHTTKIKAKVIGSGKVCEQNWSLDSGGKPYCVLICR